MRSQTSIVVVSSSAKLIVIRREDKTFLNESLKESIDKVILEQDFQDFDRPLSNSKNLQHTVEQTKEWMRFKCQTEEASLQDSFNNRRN